MNKQSNSKKPLNTDHLSIYDLPTLNAVIDQYEQPKLNKEDLIKDEGTNESGPSM